MAPEVPAEHVIYDDATFNACLVSLGCLGVVYAVVLGVRDAYDLVETTTTTTWQVFKEDPAVYLDDRENRFLQVIVSPYPDAAGDNLCLVTTRSEASATGPAARPRGDVRAPNEPGAYRFAWQMLQEQVEWFGLPMPHAVVRVVYPQGTTTVPFVEELTGVAASRVVRQARLQPVFTGSSDSDAVVWTQSPPGGTTVALGSTVTMNMRRSPDH